jgi:HK97 family phage prohead protease
MAVEIVGKPKDVKRYRKQLIEQGHNTKRARVHPVYKDKPEGFRLCQGSFKLLPNGKTKEETEGEIEDDEDEEENQGEQGTTSEDAGYDPKRRLVIAGMANANIVDRMDERVDPKGGVFTDFMKNPVLLADHMYWSSSVIGAVESLSPEDAGTGFEAVVGDPTKAPLTETQEEIRSLIAQGFIKTVSIGFIPLKIQAPEFDDEGKLIKEAVILQWSLLELSVVAVPANPDATFEMKQLVENEVSLNANGKSSDNVLTSYGRDVKNNSSSENQLTGTQPGTTKKGLDSMDEEQIKELLEGVKGMGEGLTVLAEGIKASNEMQVEMLELLRTGGGRGGRGQGRCKSNP